MELKSIENSSAKNDGKGDNSALCCFLEYHCDRHVSLRRGTADASGIMLSLHVREAAAACASGTVVLKIRTEPNY